MILAAYSDMNAQNELRNKVENRVIDAQIFEHKAKDGRISKETKSYYLKVAKRSRDEATQLMNELMGWND